jgi:hypothetical protein
MPHRPSRPLSTRRDTRKDEHAPAVRLRTRSSRHYGQAKPDPLIRVRSQGSSPGSEDCREPLAPIVNCRAGHRIPFRLGETARWVGRCGSATLPVTTIPGRGRAGSRRASPLMRPKSGPCLRPDHLAAAARHHRTAGTNRSRRMTCSVPLCLAPSGPVHCRQARSLARAIYRHGLRADGPVTGPAAGPTRP